MRQAKCIINITVCFCETMGENISVSEHTVNTIVAFHYYFYEGRTESHEQLSLHANWEQQTKESAVVDETSCCVILECLVASIACIT